MSGLGAIDTHHPLALGLVARGGAYQANHAARQADVLLALGVRFDDRTSSSWIPGYSFTIPPTKLIHVDIDPEEIGRNYPVALGLMADVRTFLRQVLAELDRRKDVATPRVAQKMARHHRRLSQGMGQVHRARLRRRLDADPSAARRSRDRQGAARRRHHGQRYRRAPQLAAAVLQAESAGLAASAAWASAPMGFGVAGVLGAKFAAPDRPCVSVCGDGAFFMHANVLGTAVEYNLPVVWVVWNNYAYASIRGLQRGYLRRPRTRDRLPPSRDRQALQSGLRRDGALGRRRGRPRRPRRRSCRRHAQGHRGQQAVSDRCQHRR